jgi:hypothetical protein
LQVRASSYNSNKSPTRCNNFPLYYPDDCKSVHHRTIQINHQPDATISHFIILTFIYSSTCLGLSPAHHQELNDCSSSLWLASRPGRSLPPGKTRHPLYRRLGGTQDWSGQVRKILPPTEIRSPDRSARSQSLYRLCYPAHSSRNE